MEMFHYHVLLRLLYVEYQMQCSRCLELKMLNKTSSILVL